MLFITKRNLSFRVYYKGDRVTIAPAGMDAADTHLMTALARNKELLAQGYLNITALTDPVAQLISYYTGRGWQVQEISS